MGREGGVALREARGPAYFKTIGSAGGHATVSRYGTGYMALIGSAGALRRIARLSAKGVTNEMASYSISEKEMIDYLNESVERVAKEKFPMEEDEPFDLQYDRDLESTDYEQVEVAFGWIPDLPAEGDFDLPAEGDEVDDDPRCAACGCYRSEHSMLGCSDGFISPEGLRAERQAIYDQLRYEDGDYDYYDGDDEVDYPEQDCPDDDCTDYDAQDPYDIEYDVP